MVHRNRTILCSGQQIALHLRSAAVPDQVPDRSRDHHKLAGCRAPLPFGTWYQLLCQNCFQCHGQLQTDLRLLIFREHPYNPVYAVDCGVCMKSRKNQVPGFCRHQRGLDGFRCPHLTDQDHIRVFPQGCVEPMLIVFYIHAHLTLVDDGALRGIHILDRVLQRNDMNGPCLVDLVQNGCQGSGLSASGFTGHQNNALIPA